MAEKLPNRPAGGREGDFGELNDWTITDIATAPKTAPEDRKNAEAEIARREEAGTYNPDEAPQEVRSDLLSHGYGVENGKVLYPKPEYKSWLESDRSGPIPRGVVRESIEDRLEAERQEATEAREAMNAEHRREFNRATGEATIRAFENTSTREKINHLPRFTTEKDELARERRAGEKARDIEIDSRREMKESNKYDNSYLNAEKIAASEARANLPIVEVTKEPAERERSPESAEARAEKLYNFYEENFAKNAPRWVSFGVSSLLEKGIVDPPTDSLLRSGFWTREEDRVHDRIDPDDDLSVETIDAEADLKTRVSRDLIGERAEMVPEDELRSAKRDGMLYAIYSGARVDSRTGKIVYSIPSERGKEVVDFMQKNGLDPNSEKLQLMSQNGFIGVMDAIKDDKKATEKGFETLDWYFDTFGYEKHMDEFMETMSEYGEESDHAFRDKFDEYLVHRKELMEWKEQRPRKEDEAIATLADSEKVTYDDLMSYLQENMSGNGEVDVFPLPDMNDRKGNRAPKVKGDHPSSTEKCTKAKAEIERIREVDPSADFLIGTVFEENTEGKKAKKQDYALIRFGNNNFNNVIAIHIGNDSRAVFAWRGKTGEDADAWRDIWRSSIRGRNPDIKRFTCKGYSKRGTLALDAQWDRVWKYLNSPEKEAA
ncbi:hypothetical protein IJI69_02385 [Candidatus Saccharibacteria bacterium]|nr:hypothetical protein [Candidatus Saccharibacteria bacterium]